MVEVCVLARHTEPEFLGVNVSVHGSSAGLARFGFGLVEHYVPFVVGLA
jgi:hypothetical protein